MRRIIAIAVVAATLAGGRADAGTIRLESYATKMDTVPIAVLPFSAAPGSPQLTRDFPSDIIADDLSFTGRFSVLRIDKVDTAAFMQRGIGIYIHGEYSAQSQDVALDCYIRDAASGDLLLGKKFTSPQKAARASSHKFANQVVEILFGDKGIFESQVLFCKKEPSAKNLFLMDYDGHNQRRVTNMKTINIFPNFIDPSSAVFVTFLKNQPDVYRVNLESGKVMPLAVTKSVETSPCVSLIENKVAFASSRSGDMDIYTCDLDGGNVKRITFGKTVDTSPCWSPTGYQIAFTSDRSGSPQIYIMDKDGANTHRLTFEGGYQDSPSWSPKGDKIAYTSFQGGKFDIWTIEPDGANAAKITSNAGANQYPTWSGDGRHVIYTCERGGRSDIWVVNADGTNPHALTKSGDAQMPDWGSF